MGIEKIGLPAKPAAKGSAWVLDASSCQSCQAAFSLFNRKHHCRRCGGLFCGYCSESKVNLRGQSDGPVRVCEPCKKLEEAARFQARQRVKPFQGAAKGTGAEEDALLNENVGDESMAQLTSNHELLASEGNRYRGNKTLSPAKGKLVEPNEGFSPEKLREQAVEQKKVYATLKREGRNAEAIQAFKRHKEFQREAEALELSLKKSAVIQRKALAAGQAASNSSVQKHDTESSKSVNNIERQGELEANQPPSKKTSQDGVDEDIFKALKDMGWNDADLTDRKMKKGPMSDMELLAEISDIVPKKATSTNPTPKKQNQTQLEVLAHKRRALALKREGKQVEAKEELKKAKLLEKKLEEMTLMEDDDEDDDDDDELAALIRSLDMEAKVVKDMDIDISNTGDKLPFSFNFGDGDGDETDVGVTDDDVNDPSMIAALQAMGWVEEATSLEQSRTPRKGDPEAFDVAASSSEPSDLQSEILKHKRQALALRKVGKLHEAKKELQEAKVLEKRLESMNSRQASSESSRLNASGAGSLMGMPIMAKLSSLEGILQDTEDVVEVDEGDMRDPEMMAALKAMGFEEEESPLETPHAKRNLQDDILSIKRSALALKKQGHVVQAKEELRKAKVLEQELLQMQDTENVVEVDEGDRRDPEMISALKAMRFEEEESSWETPQARRKMQDDILSIKRSALALKKQGNSVQAREELKKAKVLEQKLLKTQVDLEADSLHSAGVASKWTHKRIKTPSEVFPPTGFISEEDEEEVAVSADDFVDPELILALKSVGWQEEDTFVRGMGDSKEEEVPPTVANSSYVTIQPQQVVRLHQKDQARMSKLQKELLAFKRKAFTLKQEGKVEEAELELKKGKRLETEMHEINKAALGSTREPHKAALNSTTLSLPISMASDESDEDSDVIDLDMQDQEFMDDLKSFGWKSELEDVSVASERSFLTPQQRIETEIDVAQKFDFAKPPYGKNFTEPSSDAKWNSKLNSAGNKGSDMKNSEESLEVKELFHGNVRALQDIVHPVLSSSSGMDDVFLVPKQEQTFGLLKAGNRNTIVQSLTNDNKKIVDWKETQVEMAEGIRTEDNLRENPEKVDSRKQLKDDLPFQDNQFKAVNDSFSGSEIPVRNDSSLLVPTIHEGSAPIDGGAISEKARRVNASSQMQRPSETGTVSAQDEIKLHKRRALTLKREGKQGEAMEELRQAKLLQKKLEIATEELPSEHNTTKSNLTSNGVFLQHPQDFTNEGGFREKSNFSSRVAQSHKNELRQEVRQGKDRMKLQQDSLAHKRKALGLRREGKMDEADAEFELAKLLEKQMEEHNTWPRPEASDVSMVEGFLDPELMAALKELGLKDAGSAQSNMESSKNSSILGGQESTGIEVRTKVQEYHKPTTSIGSQAQSLPNRVWHQSHSVGGRGPLDGASSSSSKGEGNGVKRSSEQGGLPEEKGDSLLSEIKNSSLHEAQSERKELEERIKLEKIKALELKRSGQKGEALQILRGAKQLEKQLLSLV